MSNKKVLDKSSRYGYNDFCIYFLREWLSGGVSPCQGEGRGFESRLALFLCKLIQEQNREPATALGFLVFTYNSYGSSCC